MDNFLNCLIKKSDLNNNEYFNYKKTKPVKEEKSTPLTYSKILEPTPEDYVVFDFETTGMKPGVSSIIEIGAVKVRNGSIDGVFNTLIDPEQYIPGYISNITHITNQMVAGKRTIKEILPEFVSFIGDFPLVAHNAKFDMSFLLADANKQNIDIKNSVLDTLWLSRKFNKECAKHNLAYLTEFFNINLKNAHRAYFDALATNELYKIIQNKYYSQLEISNS